MAAPLDAKVGVLWPETEHLLAEAVLDIVRAAAPEGDRSSALSGHVLDALRDAGYCGLPVPTQMEGGGATLLECCAIQRRLARADPSVAVALNMHLFSLGVMVEHWRVEQDTSWLLLEAVATQRRLVASGFAEPGLAGSTLRSRCIARPTDDGVVIDGIKTPCSLAGLADLVCFQVQEEGEGGELLVCLVPTSAPGMHVERTWDWIGMRSSESHTLRFDGCAVPDQLIFHRCEPGRDADEIFAAGLIWFALTTAASYLGLVESAIEVAAAGLLTQRVSHLGRHRAELSTYQIPLGRVMGDLLEATAAVVATAAAMDERTVLPNDLLPTALATKRRVANLASDAIRQLIELGGAGGLTVGRPMERLVRDVQAAVFHPPTPLVTDQVIGRWALGEELEVELHEPDAVAVAAAKNTGAERL